MLKLLCRFCANCRVRKTIGTAQFSRRNASNRARSAEIILHFTAQYCVPGAARLVYLADYLSSGPDAELGRTVAATQRCLRAKLALWHGPPISAEREAEILKACLN